MRAVQKAPGGGGLFLLLCCVDGHTADTDQVRLCLLPHLGACMVELLPPAASSSKGMKDTSDASLALHTRHKCVTMSQHKKQPDRQQSCVANGDLTSRNITILGQLMSGHDASAAVTCQSVR